jgi:hypothetical protein
MTGAADHTGGCWNISQWQAQLSQFVVVMYYYFVVACHVTVNDIQEVPQMLLHLQTPVTPVAQLSDASAPSRVQVSTSCIINHITSQTRLTPNGGCADRELRAAVLLCCIYLRCICVL